MATAPTEIMARIEAILVNATAQELDVGNRFYPEHLGPGLNPGEVYKTKAEKGNDISIVAVGDIVGTVADASLLNGFNLRKHSDPPSVYTHFKKNRINHKIFYMDKATARELYNSSHIYFNKSLLSYPIYQQLLTVTDIFEIPSGELASSLDSDFLKGNPLSFSLPQCIVLSQKVVLITDDKYNIVSGKKTLQDEYLEFPVFSVAPLYFGKDKEGHCILPQYFLNEASGRLSEQGKISIVNYYKNIYRNLLILAKNDGLQVIVTPILLHNDFSHRADMDELMSLFFQGVQQALDLIKNDVIILIVPGKNVENVNHYVDDSAINCKLIEASPKFCVMKLNDAGIATGLINVTCVNRLLSRAHDPAELYPEEWDLYYSTTMLHAKSVLNDPTAAFLIYPVSQRVTSYLCPTDVSEVPRYLPLSSLSSSSISCLFSSNVNSLKLRIIDLFQSNPELCLQCLHLQLSRITALNENNLPTDLQNLQNALAQIKVLPFDNDLTSLPMGSKGLQSSFFCDKSYAEKLVFFFYTKNIRRVRYLSYHYGEAEVFFNKYHEAHRSLLIALKGNVGAYDQGRWAPSYFSLINIHGEFIFNLINILPLFKNCNLKLNARSPEERDNLLMYTIKNFAFDKQLDNSKVRLLGLELINFFIDQFAKVHKLDEQDRNNDTALTLTLSLAQRLFTDLSTDKALFFVAIVENLLVNNVNLEISNNNGLSAQALLLDLDRSLDETQKLNFPTLCDKLSLFRQTPTI